MSESKFTSGPWRWHWRFEEGVATGSVFSEPRPGHAYAVAMCPRYQSEDQWRADAALIAAAPCMLEALAGLEQFFERPGENSIERFERIAEQFHRETGIMAPGKDVSAAGGQPDREERRERYDAWVAAKVAAARAALLKATPEQSS